jgi:dipeptidyl aminopeptidase/acylaminoacyl peptidase
MFTAPYGSWPSPISAGDVARASVPFAFPFVSGGEIWWQEGRPEQGGRTTIVRDGAELLPAPWNARTRVHEYGGRSYVPVPSRGFVFVNFDDQRLYLAGDGEPAPLTPDNGDRYADLALAGDPAGEEVLCVRERHGPAGIRRSIAAVPLDGSGQVRDLVTGADFFAFPALSPDGQRLAWISWDHPRMPWDGTELRVAPAAGAATTGPVNVADVPVVMGGPDESVLAPVWRDSGSLYAISDSSGWWNLYLVEPGGGGPIPLCPREEEFGTPIWQLGGQQYAVLGDGRLAVLHGLGSQTLGVLDPGTGALDDLDLPYQAYALAAGGMTVAAVAGGPTDPFSVITVDAGSGSARVLRSESAPAGVADYFPLPVPVTSFGTNGDVVHALVYPPTSPVAQAPEGELPPFVVWVHGGPTSQVRPVLDIGKAFFTSRGIGVIDVNYGGSTGYGRAYRERLRGRWGIVDVADAITAVRALVAGGQADGKRLGIRGGSAGGWTALAAVTTGVAKSGPVFAAAVSYYGVTDLGPFAETTHDFESRYLDGLIGPLPAAEQMYIERSPIGHVIEGTCPILVLQGLDDPIVPPAQASSLLRDLEARGIPHAYLEFPGESHGFRRAETITACLEAELSFYGQIMSFDTPGIPPLEIV